jgi:hypothetical protein
VTDSPARGGVKVAALIGVTGMPEEQFGPLHGECGKAGLWGGVSAASALGAEIGARFPP